MGGANCIGSRFLLAITMFLQFIIDMHQITRGFTPRFVFSDRKAAPNSLPKGNILVETHRKATLAQISLRFLGQEGSCLDRIEHNATIHDLLMRYGLNNLVVECFSTAHIWQRRQSWDKQEIGHADRVTYGGRNPATGIENDHLIRLPQWGERPSPSVLSPLKG